MFLFRVIVLARGLVRVLVLYSCSLLVFMWFVLGLLIARVVGRVLCYLSLFVVPVLILVIGHCALFLFLFVALGLVI